MYRAKLPFVLGTALVYVVCVSARRSRPTSYGTRGVGQSVTMSPRGDAVSSVAVINVAATSKCNVYLNGVNIGGTKRFEEHDTVVRDVKKGDVIAVEVSHKKGWGGIIMDIEIGSRHYRTGHEEFKGRLKSQVGGASNAWMQPGFVSCSWDTPSPVPRPDKDVFSKSFPYQFGAMYVWASPSRQEDMYLRFVVGGENCVRTVVPNSGGQSVAPPSPVPSSSAPPSSPTPVPATAAGGSDCDCVRIAIESVGQCYEFTGEKRGNKRFCRKRDCQAKYVCVENGASSTQCMRKYVTHEVREVGQRSGKLVCTEEALETARPFYVPYA